MIDTNEVFIPTKGADPVMPLVRELRERGLVQGTDFDFKYQQIQRHYTDGYELVRNGVNFYFKDARWATFMRLKYGNELQS